MKNLHERIKMVKAMEFIARQINDEELFYNCWLTTGVADGDIEYGDLSVKDDDAETLEYYLEDENFCDLMTLFLRTMQSQSSAPIPAIGIGWNRKKKQRETITAHSPIRTWHMRHRHS